MIPSLCTLVCIHREFFVASSWESLCIQTESGAAHCFILRHCYCVQTKPQEEKGVQDRLDFLCKSLFPVSAESRDFYSKPAADLLNTSAPLPKPKPAISVSWRKKTKSAADNTTDCLPDEFNNSFSFKRPTSVRSSGSGNKLRKHMSEAETMQKTASGKFFRGRNWLNPFSSVKSLTVQPGCSATKSNTSKTGQQPAVDSLEPAARDEACRESEDEVSVVSTTSRMVPGFIEKGKAIQHDKSANLVPVHGQSSGGAAKQGSVLLGGSGTAGNGNWKCSTGSQNNRDGVCGAKVGLFEEIRNIMEDVASPMKIEVSAPGEKFLFPVHPEIQN